MKTLVLAAFILATLVTALPVKSQARTCYTNCFGGNQCITTCN
jgi:hypothetical protein